jgi:multidrug efflux pump subunit AcrA (membrane-fusion protein)
MRRLVPVLSLVGACTLGGCLAATRTGQGPAPPPPVSVPEPAPPETETVVVPAPVSPAAPAIDVAALLPPPVPTETEAKRLLTRAERLVREGQAQAARDVYANLIRNHRADPDRAQALYDLGRLLVDPNAGVRDYRAALAAFDRLVAEYPESRWDGDARAWRATLAELLARESEAARLKEDLRKLKRIDLELERRR